MKKVSLLRIIYRLGIYPRPFFQRNPFKYAEFEGVIKEAQLTKQDVVLDIGCGVGMQALMISKRVDRIVGIDIDEQRIRFASESSIGISDNTEFICTTLKDFDNPLPFSKIVSFCVIEHIEDYQSIFNECYRRLLKDGRLIVSVDSLGIIKDETAIAQHRSEQKVFNYFSTSLLMDALSIAGFSEIKIEPVFRSKYAAEKFTDGIRNHFKYGYLEAYIESRRIRRYEISTSSDEVCGLFLLASARKSS